MRLRVLRNLCVFSLLLCLSHSFVSYGEVYDPIAFRREIRDLLVDLGFEDHSSVIRANRKLKTGVGPQSDEVMKNDAARYEIFNSVRRITTDLFGVLHDGDWIVPDAHGGYSESTRISRDRLVKFTRSMLLLQPKNPLDELPDEISDMKEGGAKESAIIEYVDRESINDITEHIKRVMGGLMETAYGYERLHELKKRQKQGVMNDEDRAIVKQRNRFLKDVRRMMHILYFDHEFSQTRFLGRALSAATAMYSQEFDRGDRLFKLLAKSVSEVELSGVPLDIRNFVGDTLALENRDGQKRTIKVESGNLLVRQSASDLAYGINVAAKPHFLTNWKGIVAHGLYFGNLIGLGIHLRESERADGINSAVERWRTRVQYHPVIGPGYSHLGMAQKKTSKKYNVSMLWALDAYPGGIRKSGIWTQFFNPSIIRRAGVVVADPEGFHKHMRQKVKKHGYNRVAWEAHKANKHGEQLKTRADWMVVTPEEELRQMNAIEDAVEYTRLAGEKMAQHFLSEYLEKGGIRFATGFTNTNEALYCSQACEMAARQVLGFSMQKHPDHWGRILRLFHFFDIMGAGALNIKNPIVAPAGMYTIPYQRVHGISHAVQDPQTLLRAGYAPMMPHMREETSRIALEIGEAIAKESLLIRPYFDRMGISRVTETEEMVQAHENLRSLAHMGHIDLLTRIILAPRHFGNWCGKTFAKLTGRSSIPK